jgi:hypothetical protein
VLTTISADDAIISCSTDPFEAHLWPYREPTRAHVAPDRVRNGGEAFTYGGSGLNPDLTPTNAKSHAALGVEREGPQSSGDERDRDGSEEEGSRSSSPEFYLSDMDDDDVPLGARRGGGMGSRVRVRQGSEGYEVAPRQPWTMGIDGTRRLDGDAGLNDRPPPWYTEEEAGQLRKRMPWEEQGRYNVYQPADVYDTDSDE